MASTLSSSKSGSPHDTCITCPKCSHQFMTVAASAAASWFLQKEKELLDQIAALRATINKKDDMLIETLEQLVAEMIAGMRCGACVRCEHCKARQAAAEVQLAEAKKVVEVAPAEPAKKVVVEEVPKKEPEAGTPKAKAEEPAAPAPKKAEEEKPKKVEEPAKKKEEKPAKKEKAEEPVKKAEEPKKEKVVVEEPAKKKEAPKKPAEEPKKVAEEPKKAEEPAPAPKKEEEKAPVVVEEPAKKAEEPAKKEEEKAPEPAKPVEAPKAEPVVAPEAPKKEEAAPAKVVEEAPKAVVDEKPKPSVQPLADALKALEGEVAERRSAKDKDGSDVAALVEASKKAQDAIREHAGKQQAGSIESVDAMLKLIEAAIVAADALAKAVTKQHTAATDNIAKAKVQLESATAQQSNAQSFADQNKEVAAEVEPILAAIAKLCKSLEEEISAATTAIKAAEKAKAEAEGAVKVLKHQLKAMTAQKKKLESGPEEEEHEVVEVAASAAPAAKGGKGAAAAPAGGKKVKVIKIDISFELTGVPSATSEAMLVLRTIEDGQKSAQESGCTELAAISGGKVEFATHVAVPYVFSKQQSFAMDVHASKDSSSAPVGTATFILADLLAKRSQRLQCPVQGVEGMEVVVHCSSSFKSEASSSHVYIPGMYSFVDYLANGWEMSLVIGVDYTASNGSHSAKTSLHYTGAGHNEYQSVIHSVGSILAKYDTDQQIPAFGFGARLDPKGDANHCFALNFNEAKPECDGIPSVMASYESALEKLVFDGPTNFSPIIQRVCSYARVAKEAGMKKYYVLLIITDGEITDLPDTKNAVVEASQLPISIVIVGAGKANFSKMSALDGDKGMVKGSNGTAVRDLVQFVPFREFKAQPVDKLATVVLAEIPSQFTAYSDHHRIAP